MAGSFQQWRMAQRRKFDGDLRAFKRRALPAFRPRGHKRFFRAHRPLLLAVLVGLGLGAVAQDLLPDTTQPASSQTPDRRRSVATVIDGDTMKIAGQSIRLHGIDAPELLQTCGGWQAGEAARRTLAALVARSNPECERVTTDRYGRTVATCRVNGEDIGATMVRLGMARAYTRYSVQYLPQEQMARKERAGIHGHDCVDPAEWRATKKNPAGAG